MTWRWQGIWVLAFAVLVGCEGEGRPVQVIVPPPTSPDAVSDAAMASLDGAPEEDAAPPEFMPVEPGRWGVRFANGHAELIVAALFVPRGEGAHPGVVLLHGSGGLFREPDDGTTPSDIDAGRWPLERQFREWTDLLVGEGWAVVAPASFASRGFFDWNETPPDGVDKEERLRWRTADALAAMGYACRHPGIDCQRLAVLGVSNGGTAVLMSLFEALERVEELGGLAPPAHDVEVGVAIYPGCGLQGLVSLSHPDAYLPRRPVHVFHGEEDPLLEDCRQRATQAERAAIGEGVEPRLFLEVLPEAGHGFDSSPDDEAEGAARARVRARTLEIFTEAFAAPR